MTSSAEETAAVLRPPFVLPDAFRELFDWIERNGWLLDSRGGDRSQPRGGSPGDRYHGSQVWFRATDHAQWWLGEENAEHAHRLLPFATIGADGTRAAFWIDDDGRQRIVVLGSGSGSTLACVLADNAVDFLRLMAIGYRDVCWPEEWDSPPQTDEDDGWSPVNEPFRSWLTQTFGVTIPATAREIVPEPAEMGDEGTDDDFANWLNGLHAV